MYKMNIVTLLFLLSRQNKSEKGISDDFIVYIRVFEK